MPDAHESAQYLLAAAFGSTSAAEAAAALRRNSSLSISEAATFDRLLARRIAREPLQLIIGNWDFGPLRGIVVRQPVLVPRPETEELVGLVSRWCSKNFVFGQDVRILEVGVGSGCISISLLKLLPRALAVALDVSEDAAALTQENAVKFGVADRLDVRVTDAHNWTRDAREDAFDVLVSNPPYLDRHEMDSLAPEVSLWEDHRALRGDGIGGEGFILSMLNAASRGAGWLKPARTSRVWLETGIGHPSLLAGMLDPSLRELRFPPASGLGANAPPVHVPLDSPPIALDACASAQIRDSWKFESGYTDASGRPRFVELSRK